jgi:hypothetical protein
VCKLPQDSGRTRITDVEAEQPGGKTDSNHTQKQARMSTGRTTSRDGRQQRQRESRSERAWKGEREGKTKKEKELNLAVEKIDPSHRDTECIAIFPLAKKITKQTVTSHETE